MGQYGKAREKPEVYLRPQKTHGGAGQRILVHPYQARLLNLKLNRIYKITLKDTDTDQLHEFYFKTPSEYRDRCSIWTKDLENGKPYLVEEITEIGIEEFVNEFNNKVGGEYSEIKLVYSPKGKLYIKYRNRYVFVKDYRLEYTTGGKVSLYTNFDEDIIPLRFSLENALGVIRYRHKIERRTPKRKDSYLKAPVSKVFRILNKAFYKYGRYNLPESEFLVKSNRVSRSRDAEFNGVLAYRPKKYQKVENRIKSLSKVLENTKINLFYHKRRRNGHIYIFEIPDKKLVKIIREIYFIISTDYKLKPALEWIGIGIAKNILKQHGFNIIEEHPYDKKYGRGPDIIARSSSLSLAVEVKFRSKEDINVLIRDRLSDAWSQIKFYGYNKYRDHMKNDITHLCVIIIGWVIKKNVGRGVVIMEYEKYTINNSSSEENKKEMIDEDEIDG